MRRVFMLTLVLVSYTAAAEEGSVPPEEFMYCSTCHGVQLMGNETLGAPRLSGMDAWYVERQLQAFRKGWRGSHEDDLIGLEMLPMATALSDEQVAEVAAYVETTKSAWPEQETDGDQGSGEMFYGTCSACHGIAGEGNMEFGGPPLAGQNAWYIRRQLQLYRDGLRGAHPDDTLGQQMRAAMQILTDDAAIDDVVAYISTLTPNN